MKKPSDLKRFIFCSTLVLVTGCSASSTKVAPSSSPKPVKAASAKYVGVKACKPCHNRKNKRDQYRKWKKSAHAKAYRTLAGRPAKTIAEKLNISDPQKDAQCLECHTTAYGVPKDRLGSRFKIKDGVQCEACHGPGREYRSTMKNRKQAMKNGLILPPPEKACRKCHNSKSPTFKGFNYSEMLRKIAHKSK